MKIFFLVWLPFLISCGKNPDPRTLMHNRESIQFLNKKNLEASQKELIEALRYDPFQPELHLNLGLNLELQKDSEKALQQYLTAEKYSVTAFQKFVALFNRAQLLARNKKNEEALAEYQKALEIVPSSKEVKTNIELLIQQNQGQGQGDDKNKDQNQGDDKSKEQKEGDGKDQKDQDKNDKKEDQKKEYKPNQKYKPREFKGELSQGDVKKILDEIKQQEQKIRAEYNKKNDYKERPRDKDW